MNITFIQKFCIDIGHFKRIFFLLSDKELSLLNKASVIFEIFGINSEFLNIKRGLTENPVSETHLTQRPFEKWDVSQIDGAIEKS